MRHCEIYNAHFITLANRGNKSLKHLKQDKANGADILNVNVFEKLLRLSYSLILYTQIPKDWNSTNVTSIHKNVTSNVMSTVTLIHKTSTEQL